MSLLDKFKNLFTDEEIVEVTKEIEIEPKKEAPKLPKVMQEQIDELELTKQVIKSSDDKDDDILSDRELIKTKTKFNFPVSFDDEIVSSNKNVLSSRVAKNSSISSNQTSSKVKEIKPLYNMSAKELENTRKLYKDEKITKISKPNEKKFTRSPIISPVYSSGHTTDTFPIGSRIIGFALGIPFLKAILAAASNEFGLESTG